MAERTELFLLHSSAERPVVAFGLSDALITINVAREGRREQRREHTVESTCFCLVWFFFKWKLNAI